MIRYETIWMKKIFAFYVHKEIDFAYFSSIESILKWKGIIVIFKEN